MSAAEETNHETDDRSWLGGWFRWVPTSMAALQSAEKRVLSYMKTFYTGRYVDIGNHVGNKENRIWTIFLNEQNQNTPLVLVHGFASGVALWVLNLDSFCKNRPVYAFDVLGFGRSSRPTFSSDSQEAEKQLVNSIEEWRQQMNLDKFILLGHSMGGFLAASYSLRYPERVKHLILADPWGFPESPSNQQLSQRPMWLKAIATVLQPFNPLAGLRAAGPWGPRLVEKLRPDIKQKFAVVTEDDREAIPNYIYHCNAQVPSGEAAFKAMTANFGWAKWPMSTRLEELSTDVPVTFLYGSRSWIDHQPGVKIQRSKPNQFNLHVIQGAGHHVYADQHVAFNTLIQKVCNKVDGLPADQNELPTDISEDLASVKCGKAMIGSEKSESKEIRPLTD